MQPYLLIFPIAVPVIGGAALYMLNPKSTKLRNAFVMAVISASSLLSLCLILFCRNESFVLLHFTNALTFEMRLDGLGRFFAAVISALWPLTAVYAFSYMRGEERQNTFFSFFTISFGTALGVAAAGNMLTMYCFYELLTLSTLPLIMHSMTKKAIRAARFYLVLSIGGAAFAFIGLIFLITHGGGAGFVLGGTLGGESSRSGIMLVIYFLSFLGFGVKAAVFPLHIWLPKATVAPTPVTALLHAVAVVKAGVFAIIRLTYFSFGTEYLKGTWAHTAALYIAVFTILYGSVMAVRQQHWKKRMAYSTVSNLSYILFGAMLMTTDGLYASMMHMLNHALIKILGFFCVGAVLVNTKREYVYELNGMAKKMPLTFACFAISALALMGVPPLNGFISKWALLEAAASSGTVSAYVGAGALIIAALLTAIYMLGPCIKAFFPKKDCESLPPEGIKDAEPAMAVLMLILAAAVILTGIFSSGISELIMKIACGAY